MKRLFLMPALILCLASCAPTPPKPPPLPYDAGLRDGSVIFLRGGLLVRPIYRHTDSDLTHAAIVLYHGRDPWVYEAVPPYVRRTPLGDYIRLLEEKSRERFEQKRKMSWFIIQPRVRYGPLELNAMRHHAESQLGRPYMLRGWRKGHEVRGIFCSQLVGDIIERSGKIEAGGIHESPGSLHDKLLPFYQKSSTP